MCIRDRALTQFVLLCNHLGLRRPITPSARYATHGVARGLNGRHSWPSCLDSWRRCDDQARRRVPGRRSSDPRRGGSQTVPATSVPTGSRRWQAVASSPSSPVPPCRARTVTDDCGGLDATACHRLLPVGTDVAVTVW